MALSTTATAVEFRTASEDCQKLNIMLQQYYQGSATATKPGRFTEAQVQAAIDALQADLLALEA
jgi:hypothetical protein